MSPTFAGVGVVVVVDVLTPPPEIIPPTFKLPPMPTPPYTTNAPVLVDVLALVFDIVKVLVVPVDLAAVSLAAA